MTLELVRETTKARVDTVEGRLVFARRGQEKPYAYVGSPPDGVAQSRGDYESRAVRIENARPFAGRLSLDVEGLAVVRRQSAVRDFWDEAQTLALGHPEAAQLVKDVTGAARVARFAPHTAFEDPTTPPGTPPRQSIEFRTIAFFD